MKERVCKSNTRYITSNQLRDGDVAKSKFRFGGGSGDVTLSNLCNNHPDITGIDAFSLLYRKKEVHQSLQQHKWA